MATGLPEATGLPDVLMDKRSHLLESLLRNRQGKIPQHSFAFSLEDRHVDLPAGLAVLPDEFVEVRPGMRFLGGARQAQRGRQFGALTTGQEASGRSSAIASSVSQYKSCMGATRSAIPVGGVQSSRRTLAYW